MTKQEFIDTIKTIAEANGFKTAESKTLAEVSIIDTDRFVNIVISETHHDYDFSARTVTCYFKVKASCATCGGWPTADELLRQASAMTRAANLMNMADMCERLGKLNYTMELYAE